jgi:hypothetical protein
MNLAEARERIGERVVYVPSRRYGCGRPEEGVITSVNDRYVFVRYDAASYSKAALPEDLEAIR